MKAAGTTWDDQLGLAVVHLKLSPSEFWAMTPGEFDGLCRAFLKAQPGYVEPVTREEFEALLKRFPDKPPRKVH